MVTGRPTCRGTCLEIIKEMRWDGKTLRKSLQDGLNGSYDIFVGIRNELVLPVVDKLYDVAVLCFCSWHRKDWIKSGVSLLWPCVLSLSLRCWRERCRFKAKTGKRRWPWSSSKTLYIVRALISSRQLTAFITAFCTSEKRRVRLSSLPPPSQPRGKRRSYFRGDKVQHSGERWGRGEIREMDSSVLIAMYNSEGREVKDRIMLENSEEILTVLLPPPSLFHSQCL